MASTYKQREDQGHRCPGVCALQPSRRSVLRLSSHPTAPAISSHVSHLMCCRWSANLCCACRPASVSSRDWLSSPRSFSCSSTAVDSTASRSLGRAEAEQIRSKVMTLADCMGHSVQQLDRYAAAAVSDHEAPVVRMNGTPILLQRSSP